MPTECITNPLQRELADSIIRMVPLDEIRILLACGAKVNESVTQGLMPLHYAVWQRYFEATQLLLVRGSEVNAVDECGYSALHLAAEHGYKELVDLLLKSGANVDYRPPTDEPYPRTTLCDEPLRLAIRNKHLDIARTLLEHGADPNKRYFFGSEINLINDLDFLELLLTFSANPDSRDRSGLTPLMKAARQNSGMPAVLLLLSHGADVNATADERHDYRTVLHYAVLSGNVAIVNLLIKQGAKLNCDPEKPSALDLAILKGDLDIVRLLIAAGADVNRSSPVIGSPLHVACADNIANRYEIVQLLLETGADPNVKVYGEPPEPLDADGHVVRGPQLRPVLVEYLASNEQPSFAVIQLLLRHGARVIMKTQFRDPDGCLNALHNLGAGSEENTEELSNGEACFYLLLEACESFDPCMIRRNSILGPKRKGDILDLASTPLSLRRQVRLFLRRLLSEPQFKLAGPMEKRVELLDLPNCLRKYLLFDYS